MKHRVKRVLLTRHTDEELTSFLQSEAEKGWWLEKNRGNKFYFRRQDYDGRRVLSYTFSSRGPESSTETQLRRELPIIRKTGWDTLCLGGPENVFDSRRHAFLYEEKKGSTPPQLDEDETKKAKKRERNKIISNLVLLALYSVFFIFLFASSLIKVVSDNIYIFFLSLLSILFLVSLGFAIRSFVFLLNRKHDKKGFRSLDRATYLIFIALLALLCFLLFDTLWGNNDSKGQRINVGKEEIVIYSDDIPITLEDLNMSTEGEYRTKKRTNSKSILSSYSYSYDQSFGGEYSGLSFISYTIFSSPFASLRSAIKKQEFPYKTIADVEKAAKLNVDSITRVGNEYMIEKGNSVIFFKSSEPVKIEMIDSALLELLL